VVTLMLSIFSVVMVFWKRSEEAGGGSGVQNRRF